LAPPASLLRAAGNTSAPAQFVAEPFSSLPGWPEDDHRPAYEAFRRCATQARVKPYRTGGLGVPCSAFAGAFAAAIELERPDMETARGFFESHFRPFLIEAGGPGFLTGYYEPEAEASPVRTPRHTVPLYRQPDDLVEIGEGSSAHGIEPGYRFARRTQDRLVPYFDRREIESGALAGRGLEIAWLADPVDAFFIHVQGAARLAMTDGSSLRVTYAAKSGHPFTGPGRVLAAMGEIPLQDVTMQSIRAWFRRNPGRVNEILWQNRSFIFFRETEPGDAAKGPVAAAKVQLEPGRSLAVDRDLHTFATPFFIDAPELTAFGGKPFRRLMIAQDTGSAIVGAARGDIFAGTGADAGEIAGVVKHPGRFHMLLPLPFAETLSGASA
jgi:membrane-bound lytic murein transglycosylase A